jgi:DNA-binding protein Fis
MLESYINSMSLSQLVAERLKLFFLSHTESLPQNLYSVVLHQVEKPLIIQTLICTRGNQIRAAEILGISRNTLRQKIKQFQIEIDSLRQHV